MSTSPVTNSQENSSDWTGISCDLFSGDEQKCVAIIAVKKTTATISLIGCLFMIIVIWLFRKYTAFTQRMILNLSIAALCLCICYLMGDQTPDGHWCNFQGWIMTYFDWSVLLWVCCLTFNLYMNAIRMVPTEKFEWMYHIVCWGASFGIACLPLIGDHYGPAGMWCWIVDDWKWRFGVYYAPLFLILGALLFVYIYIFFMISKKIRTWEGLYDPDIESRKELLKEQVKPLMWYPCIFLALSIFPLINRIQNAVHHEPVFALVLLSALFSPLTGAVNAVVFGMDKETRSRLTIGQLKAAFHSYFHRRVILEYPVQVEQYNPNPPEQNASKFNNVSYSRLT